MKTIHCDIYILKGRERIPLIPPAADAVPEGMTDLKAAHFILNKARESLPPLPESKPHLHD